ncbi:MAG: CapA family protein [Muribaculaceae bacterium]|nr:CapA family protein [Muribaculaceae bacterium]
MPELMLADIVPLIISLFSFSPYENDRAEILFAGDAMQHQAQIDAARRPDGTYDYSECFQSIREYVAAADLAVVNFEASLGGKPYTGYPCFSAPDEYPAALTDAGFDVFLLANNHILDRRDRGLHRTLDRLRHDSIPHLGIYHDTADRDSLCPLIMDVNGFKIGLLNYTYGTNGIAVTGNAVVDYIDHEKIRNDIIAARNGGAEIVSVCVHWGDEYRLLPNNAQRDLADWLTELDVDMIIGNHPHVVQPMEMRTSRSGRPILLTYSLGNLISNMKTTDTRGGAMVTVSLRRNDSGEAYVSSARYLTTFTEPPSDGHNFRVVPAEHSTHRHAKAFLINVNKIPLSRNVNVKPDTLFIFR